MTKTELVRELRNVASFDEAIKACLKAADYLEGLAVEPTTRQAITKELLLKADDSTPDPDPIF